MRKRGHFIVIEGTDGSGKGTQSKMLRKKLQIMNYPHQAIEFPRYTGNPYGKLVAKYLRGEFGQLNTEVGTYLVSLAYAGDRFLAKPQIQQWLKEGSLVIADRYVPSNKAYMSAKLPFEHRDSFIEWLDDLEYNINGIPREELVIFLYVPPKTSQENVGKKNKRDYLDKASHDIHEADLNYLTESSKMYLHLAKQEPNWVVIECMKKGEMKSIQQIHEEVMSILKEKKIL